MGESTKQVSPRQKNVNFTAANDENWTRGDYRAEVSLNGEKIEKHTFQVVNARQAAAEQGKETGARCSRTDRRRAEERPDACCAFFSVADREVSAPPYNQSSVSHKPRAATAKKRNRIGAAVVRNSLCGDKREREH